MPHSVDYNVQQEPNLEGFPHCVPPPKNILNIFNCNLKTNFQT